LFSACRRFKRLIDYEIFTAEAAEKIAEGAEA